MFRSVFAPLATSALIAIAPSAPYDDGAADPCPQSSTAGVVIAPQAIQLAALTSFGVGAGNVCPRPAAGTVAEPPPDLFSRNGVLNVDFLYSTTVDAEGRALYCFRTADGRQSPTLHLRPGDILNMSVYDAVPPQPGQAALPFVIPASAICGAARATPSSVNVHFHGTNTAPVCHADQVIHTIIDSGQTFQYRVKFPVDEPPGLYWYHPHIYGLSEAAVQGGASGAIIIEGVENVQPEVAGLPERVLIARDQTVPQEAAATGTPPAWDLSLNYVPVPYPNYPPAVIPVRVGTEEFWRLANASADTILDVQLQFDGVPQPLKIVALDGVPVGSRDGTGLGKTITQTDIRIPPAGRAEFIVPGLPAKVRKATLLTLPVDTGPDGDNDPLRPIAVLQPTVAPYASIMPHPSQSPGPRRFANIDSAPVTAHRKLYFSEVLSDPTDPNSPTNFFITVNGATPTLFSPNNPPAITTQQGSVEDWTIENRALESHEFHIHQIHFKLLERNGVNVPAEQQQFVDTINVPYWSGSGPYPSVTVRMDFRGLDVGDFVYHCHILGHEDAGMMAIIRVKPHA